MTHHEAMRLLRFFASGPWPVPSQIPPQPQEVRMTDYEADVLFEQLDYLVTHAQTCQSPLRCSRCSRLNVAKDVLLMVFTERNGLDAYSWQHRFGSKYLQAGRRVA